MRNFSFLKHVAFFNFLGWFKPISLHFAKFRLEKIYFNSYFSFRLKKRKFRWTPHSMVGMDNLPRWEGRGGPMHLPWELNQLWPYKDMLCVRRCSDARLAVRVRCWQVQFREPKTDQQKAQLYYEDDPLCPIRYIIDLWWLGLQHPISHSKVGCVSLAGLTWQRSSYRIQTSWWRAWWWWWSGPIG